MHIYPIFVERRLPPKGHWQLVGEWIRAMEWPDATEKGFLIKQSKRHWVLNKFGRKLYRTLSSWPYGVADPRTLAFHLASELIREYRKGTFKRPIQPNGRLTDWFIDNW
jgi:hypothetical protein